MSWLTGAFDCKLASAVYDAQGCSHLRHTHAQLETFSSAILIDREEIWNISHSDWLDSCSYACAYFTPIPTVEISVYVLFSKSLRRCILMYETSLLTQMQSNVLQRVTLLISKLHADR